VLGIFEIGSQELFFMAGLISVSSVAGITGMNHWHPVQNFLKSKN
jgi:hypothetical protein